MSVERRITRADIKWQIKPKAKQDLKPVRVTLGEEEYLNQVSSLQELLCNYFNAGASGGCANKGLGISPLGSSGASKWLKVRWALPGCGKSGGLRLAIEAYCTEMRVVVARPATR